MFCVPCLNLSTIGTFKNPVGQAAGGGRGHDDIKDYQIVPNKAPKVFQMTSLQPHQCQEHPREVGTPGRVKESLPATTSVKVPPPWTPEIRHV